MGRVKIRHFGSLFDCDAAWWCKVNTSPRREKSMKGLLLAIVVVQLVCHAPRTGLNIYEMVMVRKNRITWMSFVFLVPLCRLFKATQSTWTSPGWSTSLIFSSSSPPPATSSSWPSRSEPSHEMMMARGFCPHILQLLKIEYALMAQVEIVCHLHRSTYI